METIMETIGVKCELLFALATKEEWVIKVPEILPAKITGNEQWVWVDKNGYIFISGADFTAAKRLSTYPCKVYRLISVAEQEKEHAPTPTETTAQRENISLNYIIGEHPEKKDTIIISIQGTGLNVSNPEHKEFLHAAVGVVAPLMYGKANAIASEAIHFEIKK